MAAALPQRRPARPTDFYWWSTLLGLLLLALNVCFYFQSLLSDILGWAIPLQDNFEQQLLLYVLIGFFCSFLVGGIRGYATRQTQSTLYLSQLAEAIGFVPVVQLSIVIGMLIILAPYFQGLRDFLLVIAGHYRG